MKKPAIEKFSLATIADTLGRADVREARTAFRSACGSILEVSGKVQKVVRRDGQYKIVIEPNNATGLIVFANCQPEAETAKIRKGSLLSIRGKFQTFGSAAVCLSECRIIDNGKIKLPKSTA